MKITLNLPDGQKVRFGDRTQGGSKNHTRYGSLDNGRPVVVKVQATHGQLLREEAALTFAARRGLPTPTMVGSGTTPDGDFFIVLTKETGVSHQPTRWLAADGTRLRTPGQRSHY